MKARRASAGFSLVEMLVSLALLTVGLAAVASFALQSSRTNKAELLRADVQANARATLSLVVQTLRTAGWDPRGLGFAPVTLDSNPADGVETIQVFADLNADKDITDAGEAVTIRQTGTRVEWRLTSDVLAPFEVVGVNIDNDANGDGTPEIMFTPDATPNPARIRVRITATSPVPDPTSGQPIRYTVSSDVLLRNAG